MEYNNIQDWQSRFKKDIKMGFSTREDLANWWIDYFEKTLSSQREEITKTLNEAFLADQERWRGWIEEQIRDSLMKQNKPQLCKEILENGNCDCGEHAETPMGVSQWKQIGLKYGFWNYFETEIRKDLEQEIQTTLIKELESKKKENLATNEKDFNNPMWNTYQDGIRKGISVAISIIKGKK